MGRLIDCDKLCTDLLERWNIADKNREDQIRWLMADVVTPIVACQPTVDAVPVVHGRWIHRTPNNGHTPPYDECDNCGWEVRIKTNFCPNCGADMRKDGEAHD